VEIGFKANPGKTFMRPPSQPIKDGHGGIRLPFQLHRRTAVQAGLDIKGDPISKITKA
jgi:hypothetical protein